MAKNTAASNASGMKRQPYNRKKILDRISLLVNIMRVQAGWNQSEFARRSGISVPKLSHYMSRRYKPDIDTLAHIADNIGVSMEWLVFGHGPMWARDINAQAIGRTEWLLATSAALADAAKRLRASATGEETDVLDAFGIGAAIDQFDQYITEARKAS